MRIGRWIGWMAMLVVSAATLTARNATEPTLTVLIYDYTSLPASELDGAMAVAQGVFRNASVPTKWVQCVAAYKSGQGSACREALGTAHVLVNIIRSDWPGSANRQPRMGAALLDAKGRRPGITAYVFQQGVQQAVRSGGRDDVQILGHVVAHEVGHLLLGTESHSKTGIMQTHWAGSQIARTHGGLTFTLDQARRIRVNIKARMHNKK